MISDTDIGQSLVRLSIGAICLVIMMVFEGAISPFEFSSKEVSLFFVTLAAYVLISFLVTITTVTYLAHSRTIRIVRRTTGVILDLAMAGIGLHFTEEYSLIMFSVVLTIVIGYGFRFGLRYLIFGVFVGLIVVGSLAIYSPYYVEHQFISAGLIVSIILVPTYAASLLSKYQRVLRQLEYTNLARSRFIANMSHELRTPLHAIVMNTEILLENVTNRKFWLEAEGPLQIVSNSAEHLKGLVDRVLDTASGEAGVFTLEAPEGFDFYYLLRNAVNIGGAQARKKDVEVILSVDPSTPRFLVGWRQQMMEILINTVGNAAKFTDSGCISVQTFAIEHTDGGEGRRLFIEIIDTGIGMSQEQLALAFAPFVLGDDSLTRRYEGTGIGLTITKQYVEAMGGEIELESQRGDGVHVKIQLPCEESETSASLVSPEHGSFLLVTEVELSQTQLQEIEALNVKTLLLHSEAEVDLDLSGVDSIIVDNKIVLERRRTVIANGATPVTLLEESHSTPGSLLPEYLFKINKICRKQLDDLSALCVRRPSVRTSFSRKDSCTILLVDDNENNLLSAELVLRNAGHLIDTAISGDEGLLKLQSNLYDLVFIDMHMPGKNGLKTLETARRNLKSLPPIVFLTADVTQQATTDAMEAGAAGLITKPLSPEALRSAVEKYALNSSNYSQTKPGIDCDRTNQTAAYAEIEDMLNRGISKEQIGVLLEKFVHDVNRNFLQCGIAAAQGEHKQVRRLSHRIQGSAGAMHFNDLADRLAVIQKVGNDEICQTYLASVEDLQSLSNTLTKDLKNYLFDES